MNSENPLLVVRPKFVFWIYAVTFIPVFAFVGAWLSAFGYAFMKSHNGQTDFLSSGILYGALAMFVVFIPFGLFLMSKNYKATTFSFFKDRLEYDEGFLVKQHKTIKYDKIAEVNLVQGILQRTENLGSIYLATPATGFTVNMNRGHSGIALRDILDPQEYYKKIKQIIDNGKVAN